MLVLRSSCWCKVRDLTGIMFGLLTLWSSVRLRIVWLDYLWALSFSNEDEGFNPKLLRTVKSSILWSCESEWITLSSLVFDSSLSFFSSVASTTTSMNSSLYSSVVLNFKSSSCFLRMAFTSRISFSASMAGRAFSKFLRFSWTRLITVARNLRRRSRLISSECVRALGGMNLKKSRSVFSPFLIWISNLLKQSLICRNCCSSFFSALTLRMSTTHPVVALKLTF